MRSLLLMASAVGAAVAGSAGAGTGGISRRLMIDVWEGQKEAGSWFFSDGYRWLFSVKIDLSSARDRCAEDELHEK